MDWVSCEFLFAERSGRKRRLLCTFLRNFSSWARSLEKSSDVTSESVSPLWVNLLGEPDVEDSDVGEDDLSSV